MRSNVGNTIPIPANKSTMPVNKTRLALSFTQGNGKSAGLNIFIEPAQTKVIAKSTCAIQRIMFIVFDVFCSVVMKLLFIVTF